MRTLLCVLALAAAAPRPASAAGLFDGLRSAAASRDLEKAGKLGEAELLAKAKEEGTLTWYGIATPFNEAVVKAFSKRYPDVKVERTFTGGFQVLQRYSADSERGYHVADCVSAGIAEAFPDMRRKGWLAKLDNLDTWGARPGWTKDPNGAYFFYANFKVGLVWNQELVEDAKAPKSFAELADPRWNGKLAIVDPRTGGFGVPLFRFIEGHKALGPDWIRKVRANDPLLSFQAAQLSEALSSGRRGVGIIRDTEALGARKQGAKLGFAVPSEGTLVHQMPIAVNRRAPHPHAARLFVRWLLSDEAQQALAAEGVGFPLSGERADVERQGGVFIDVEHIDAQETKTFLARMNALFR